LFLRQIPNSNDLLGDINLS